MEHWEVRVVYVSGRAEADDAPDPLKDAGTIQAPFVQYVFQDQKLA